MFSFFLPLYDSFRFWCQLPLSISWWFDAMAFYKLRMMEKDVSSSSTAQAWASCSLKGCQVHHHHLTKNLSTFLSIHESLCSFSDPGSLSLLQRLKLLCTYHTLHLLFLFRPLPFQTPAWSSPAHPITFWFPFHLLYSSTSFCTVFSPSARRPRLHPTFSLPAPGLFSESCFWKTMSNLVLA